MLLAILFNYFQTGTTDLLIFDPSDFLFADKRSFTGHIPLGIGDDEGRVGRGPDAVEAVHRQPMPGAQVTGDHAARVVAQGQRLRQVGEVHQRSRAGARPAPGLNYNFSSFSSLPSLWFF